MYFGLLLNRINASDACRKHLIPSLIFETCPGSVCWITVLASGSLRPAGLLVYSVHAAGWVKLSDERREEDGGPSMSMPHIDRHLF